MRGKIIQYNGADGSGTIVAEGKQYKFALAAWRGDSAPAVNKTVEIELDGDSVTAVIAVGDDVLLKEKAAEMSDKLGSLWNKAAASVQARTAANAPGDESAAGGAAVAGAPAIPALGNIPFAGSITELYGIVLPIAWLLFLIFTLTLDTASQSIDVFGVHRTGLGVSMFNLSTMMAPFGGGGGVVKALLILGYLSIGVPMLWRNRRSWLTLLLPLIAVIWAFGDVLYVKGHVPDASSGLGIASYSIGFGVGFWLALIMAIIVAVLAVKRFLKSS